MPLPRPDQYQLALQNPQTAFRDADLKSAKVESTPLGWPKVISGGFALTYHFSNARGQWAVRCLHRESPDLERRYAAISAFLANRQSDYFVDAKYIRDGVFVDGGWYPIIKMPWIDAAPINRYIEDNLSPERLRDLAARFKALVAELRRLGVAHGDLQHGNILVDRRGALKLVDYDGMFVPQLRGLPANESGHPNYQHPLRQSQFDSELDRFSALVILVALEALALNPTLWRSAYNTGDNLLFKQADFLDPASSRLFGELKRMPGVGLYAERLADICLGDYSQIPTLDEFLSGAFRVPARRVQQPSRVRAPSVVLDASVRSGLLQHEGDVVTVVGKITAVHKARTRYGQPYAFLNFGDWRSGCFTLVLWSEALELFNRLGVDVDKFKDRWVRVNGLITVYRPTGRGRAWRPEQPQLVIEMPSQIAEITLSEAKDLLGSAVSPRSASHPVIDDSVPLEIAQVLNRLYGAYPVTRRPASPRDRPLPGPLRRPSAQVPARGAAQQATQTQSELCFVATAVYGDPQAQDVVTLRRFRDEVLSRTLLGRLAIAAYWIVGPRAAVVVQRLPATRRPLRWLLRQTARRVEGEGSKRAKNLRS